MILNTTQKPQKIFKGKIIMLCDNCKKDVPFWKLFQNGKYKHNDALFKIVKRKMEVCWDCLQKEGE
jgi:hypothetical protein